MDSQKTICINGQDLTFEPEETILEVASRNGIHIPTLCHLKGATPTGACRMCVVEVEGARNLVASCAAPAGPGMKVLTDSPRVLASRRTNIELLLASGSHNCLAQDLGSDSWTAFQLEAMETDEHQTVCPAYGNCKLQDLAIQYRVRSGRFEPKKTTYALENVNPFIMRDFSRCILCGRCVQACNEIQVNNAISYGYRGAAGKVVAKGDRALKDSDCVFCGECLQACPVGALVALGDLEVRPFPGTTRKTQTTCGYCGVGCQMHLHVKEEKVVKVTGVEGVAPNNGRLCVRGRFETDFIATPERLTTPLIRENGTLRKASWEEALKRVGKQLGNIRREQGADSIAFLGSPRLSNEDSYLLQKLARAVIGTNNVDQTLGKTTAVYRQIASASAWAEGLRDPMPTMEKRRAFLAVGTDLTEEMPVLAAYVKRGVVFGEAPLVVAGPQSTGLNRFASVWLKTAFDDAAWVKGLIHLMLRDGLVSSDAAEKGGVALKNLKGRVAGFGPEKVAASTGISQDDLMRAARLLGAAGSVGILCGPGLAMANDPSETAGALKDLAALCGCLGPAGGLYCLFGESNLRGACAMGVGPDLLPGGGRVEDESARRAWCESWGVKSLPSQGGIGAGGVGAGLADGRLKGLYLVGEHPTVKGSILDGLAAELPKADFVVVQTIASGPLTEHAHVVLPGLSFAEKEGTFTNTEGRIQEVRPALSPMGESRADWRILVEVAQALGAQWDYPGLDAVRRECGIEFRD